MKFCATRAVGQWESAPSVMRTSADSGYDIICAAVSALELNFANSVAELTDAKFETHFGEEEGSFDFVLLGKRNENAELLLKSLLLGYAAIRQEYGSEYLLIKDQEV